MHSYIYKTFRTASVLLLTILFLYSCNSAPQATNTSEPLPTQTQIENTPTSQPDPLALKVNDISYTMAEYDKEIERLKMALAETGTVLSSTEQKQKVIDEWITTALLEDAAIKAGHTVRDEEVKARIEELSKELGGSAAYLAWLNKFQYDESSYQKALQHAMLADWQRDQIINQVPQTAEQVHLQQLFTREENKARSWLGQLQAGIDFATLAKEADPVLKGDLGWVPKGYLLQPELNEPAFNTRAGEYTDVIKTSIGFHILLIVERDETHALSSDARIFLQRQAFENWIKTQKEQATIEILVP